MTLIVSERAPLGGATISLKDLPLEHRPSAAPLCAAQRIPVRAACVTGRPQLNRIIFPTTEWADVEATACFVEYHETAARTGESGGHRSVIAV